jgi:DNA-binding PadR family transcriptional regulator
MSLRYGLLGLLAEGPASGYDLNRRFQETLGAAWPAQHPKIYAELGRLADDGLIEVDSHGPRRRKAYRITEDGRAAVRRWLVEGADGGVDHTLRFEPLLRTFFLWLMEPEDVLRHLEGEERFYTEWAELFRGMAEAKDRGDYGTAPSVQSFRVTIEAAVRMYQALADWARWATEFTEQGRLHQRGQNGASPSGKSEKQE